MATIARDMQKWRSDESNDEQSSYDTVEFKIFHSPPKEVLEYLNKCAAGYTWYAERLVPLIGADFVYGKVYYADAIDDEWYIVYLLLCTSEMFKEAWIRVWDSDGEFLLVEAAESLPRWLNPEVASNRVWLKEGKLLIVTKELAPGNVSETEAREYLGDKTRLMYSAAMDKHALRRARRFPNFLEEHYHHAVVSIPRTLACCLHDDPTLVRALATWSPTSTISVVREDLVNVSVRFTRLQYGQLLCEFDPSPLQADSSNKKRVEEKVCSNFDAIRKRNKPTQEVDTEEPYDPKVMLMRALSSHLSKSLPSDKEISEWDKRADDDSWLNVSNEKFDSLLKAHGSSPTTDPSSKADNIMHSFGTFLGKEKASWAGVEMSSGSSDDGDDEDESSHSGNEVEDMDSDEFDRAFMEMLHDRNILHDSEEEETSIQGYMDGAAEELREAGLIADDDATSTKSALNMLESLKTQGALPGPAGNILRSLGILGMNIDNGRPASPLIDGID